MATWKSVNTGDLFTTGYCLRPLAMADLQLYRERLMMVSMLYAYCVVRLFPLRRFCTFLSLHHQRNFLNITCFSLLVFWKCHRYSQLSPNLTDLKTTPGMDCATSVKAQVKIFIVVQSMSKAWSIQIIIISLGISV
jgi:hypothetical protein